MIRRRGFSLIELLVAVASIAILTGLLLSAVQKALGTAARAKCQNNLKQLALALHQRHDARNVLPPGHRYLLNPERLAFSGWTLDALPYLEQQAVYDRGLADYRRQPSFFTPTPHPTLSIVISTFLCAADPRVDRPQVSARTKTLAAFTSFLGVSGRDYKSKDGVLYQESRVSLLGVADGTSNTLMLGERPPSHDFQFGWWYAGVGQRLTGSAEMILGVREQNLLPIVSGSNCGPGAWPFVPAAGFDDPCGMFHFWSPHPGGANFALCDGSVRFLRYEANDILPALATRAGGEAVGLPD